MKIRKQFTRVLVAGVVVLLGIGIWMRVDYDPYRMILNESRRVVVILRLENQTFSVEREIRDESAYGSRIAVQILVGDRPFAIPETAQGTQSDLTVGGEFQRFIQARNPGMTVYGIGCVDDEFMTFFGVSRDGLTVYLVTAGPRVPRLE